MGKCASRASTGRLNFDDEADSVSVECAREVSTVDVYAAAFVIVVAAVRK